MTQHLLELSVYQSAVGGGEWAWSRLPPIRKPTCLNRDVISVTLQIHLSRCTINTIQTLRVFACGTAKLPLSTNSIVA